MMRTDSEARRSLTRLAPLLLAAAVGLGACSEKAMLDKASTAEDRALATIVIRDLQTSPAGDADLKARMAPELAAKLAPLIPRMRAALPADGEAPSRLVGATFSVTEGDGHSTRNSGLTYEVDSRTAHALVRLQILRQDRIPQLTGLYVNPLDRPIEQLTAFNLSGKPLGSYLILALTVLSLLTIVTSEIVLFRTPWIRRKWLWAISCLVGVVQISVNWSTGAVSVQPLMIQLLGAFAVRPDLLSAWQVGFAIPIPSIVFLLMRNRLQKPPASAGRGDAAVATF